MKSEEEIRDFIVGKQDHTIKNYKCLSCKTIQSTYESYRICICGGGFFCPKCNGVNMNSSIEWVLNGGQDDEQK